MPVEWPNACRQPDEGQKTKRGTTKKAIAEANDSPTANRRSAPLARRWLDRILRSDETMLYHNVVNQIIGQHDRNLPTTNNEHFDLVGSVTVEVVDSFFIA